MTLYKRKNTWWGSFQIDGTRHQVSLKTPSKPEASKRLRVLHAQKAREALLAPTTPEPPKAPLLSVARDRCYNERWQHNRTGDRSYAQIGVVITALGDLRLDEITSAKIQALQGILHTKGLGPATINRHLAALRTLLSLACTVWEVIDRVPALQMRKEPEGRLRFLTPDEERQILALCCPRVRDLYIVLLDTGLRLGEGIAIQDGGTTVAPDLSSVTVTAAIAKGKKSRMVPTTPRVREVLERGLNVQRHEAQREWQRVVRKELGLTDVELVIHSLRHTFCSRLVQRGISLAVVQKLAGHASISTTERYIHLRDEDLVNAIKALEAINT